MPSFLSRPSPTGCRSTRRDKRAKTWAGVTAAGSWPWDHLGPDSKNRARSIAYGYGSNGQQFVAMPKDPGAGVLFAHELGHYLHLPHTHVGPLTLAQTRDEIRRWVESQPDAKAARQQVVSESLNLSCRTR